MIEFISLIFYVLSLFATTLIAIPILVFFGQVVSSLLHNPQSKSIRPYPKRPSIAVLIPAHNESAGIRATIESILPQLNSADRILVVADNCTDSTASIARDLGAAAIERTDPERRGKGFALDFGIRFLEKNRPEIVLVIDADCKLHPGSIEALVTQVVSKNRPAQALDLMISSNQALAIRLGVFAWRIKNLIRPLGMKFWGAPCQLLGTGMAFPWELIRTANLATGHLAEDMQLGIDLAFQGKGAIFVPEALVTSEFPESIGGAEQQRSRWIYGHFDLLFNKGPKLFINSIYSADPKNVLFALDLMVPPLGVLLLLSIAQFFFGFFALILWGSSLLMGVAIGSLVLLSLAGFLSWFKYCREVISFADLMSIPLLIGKRIPIYVGFWAKRKLGWIRAKRSGE
jgi:cellulose synthase/poly-beta-1,6-N-acetylglucosamine synthase-like glycosyltransferase